ncbi:alpha/beta hydrolase family protein [Marixanthomonas spongiae]|uniref:Alpha/beta hydrolase n=1 Tax=Marixanthomonas spongiae TaxID=2174845 RepID=A0A2U0I2L0_9FLAO|nr:alpha/beta fold hydrolase [Marixanthomonas spongiae]PVW15230.1 alpha/beta hydrolase [Marixanthomonas spongiae]
MMIEHNNILHRAHKKPIVYDVYFTETQKPKPIVIFCHGYKGFKDWGAWHLVAEAFAKAGFFFIKFNFSYNGGTVDEPIDFPDLEAFAQNNYTKELDDLEYVIDYVATTKRYVQEAEVKNISLIGHSRGGGIALIKAEENDKIKKVVTWAGVSDYKVRFKEGSNEFKEWKEKGVKYVENGRTKQQMPHYFQFYTNFKENEERLTIKRAVEQLEIPQLIVHGGNDSTVSAAEAKNLHQWSPESTLKIIEDANHVFGTKHPWEKGGLPSPMQEVVNFTIDFLK